MKQFQEEWNELRCKRFRLTKKFLRYLPSRSTLRKSFIFNKFGHILFDKYPQIWSFSYASMRSAYYAGWILTFLPVMGIQIVLAIVLSILFRANVMVLVALQMLSNPFTVGFLWTFEYQIGKKILDWLPFHDKFLLQNTIENSMAHGIRTGFLKATLSICIGGIVLGLICAKISCWIHKYFTRKSFTTYEQFLEDRKQTLKKLKDHSLKN